MRCELHKIARLSVEGRSDCEHGLVAHDAKLYPLTHRVHSSMRTLHVNFYVESLSLAVQQMPRFDMRT
jgi:hypothetical protein